MCNAQRQSCAFVAHRMCAVYDCSVTARIGPMIEKQLLAWRESEHAALQAEGVVRRLEQCAEGPHMAAMCEEARALRTHADALFEAVQAALPPDRP